MISGQVYAFFCCIISGITIGLLFDSFRIIRKFAKTNDMITYIEDIIFWILVGGIMLFTFYQTNNGQIRGYLFLGIIIGATIYFLAVSKYIIKTLTYIISAIINIISIINKAVISPISKLWKVLVKAIRVVLGKFKINVQKTCSEYRGLIGRIKSEKNLRKKHKKAGEIWFL